MYTYLPVPRYSPQITISTMAKKGKQINGDLSAKNPKSNGDSKIKSSSSLASLSLPGIILAVGAAYMYHSGKSSSVTPEHDVVPHQQTPSRELFSPPPGSWTDGFYTTSAVTREPSTHALLYQNGGMGEPELVSFMNDEEFLALGRLYNDLGQIVQSPSHFLNGTALYRGPTKPG